MGTLGGTIYWIVLAREYAASGSVMATVRSATVGRWGSGVFNLADLGPMLLKSAELIVLNYPTPLVLAGVVGVWALVRRRDAFSWILSP